MDDLQEQSRRKQYRRYLKSELEAAAIYSALAQMEQDSSRAGVFEQLVEAEMRHAGRWAGKLGVSAQEMRPPVARVKVQLVKWGARIFGTNRVVPLLLRGEDREVTLYASDPEASDLVQEERGHARTLRRMARPRAAEELGRANRLVGSGGTLRAAVLGVNDGLVSNFSLVMGVAGGTGNADFVLLAGVAGLLAGAFSMAAGEYVSMRSQRDIYEHEIQKEEVELREWPEEEELELALIYQAKGLSRADSERIAKSLMADPQVALDTMAREELGLDPKQLGSPRAASISSFTAFLAGAIVPILPYILRAGDLAFSLSAILSAGALVIVGGALAMISGVNAAWGALRMLLAGGAAAAVTFGVGRLIGVSVSGPS